MLHAIEAIEQVPSRLLHGLAADPGTIRTQPARPACMCCCCLMLGGLLQVQELSKAVDAATEETQLLQTEMQEACKA